MRTETADGLSSRAFEPLPLGAVTPDGWLRRQLRIQADGLTGHLDDVWADLADNAWLGGQHDGWERGPYYADGLVPIAALLEDDDLEARAQRWVEGFLEAQDDRGQFVPDRVSPPVDPTDPWPRFVIAKVLRQYYEATGDDRALEAIRSFARFMLEHPDDWSLADWAELRWMEFAVTCHWLYEHSGDEWLLDVVDLLVGRGFDWIDHFEDFEYLRKQADDPEMATHVVNNAMGIKAPGVYYRQTGDEDARRAVAAGIDVLDRFHGQVTGVFTGDEHFSGKHPSQGTELCGVVEYMYSLEYLGSLLGTVEVGDRLERITYNALPATFTPDMWAHQYDQQVNQVLCTVDERAWTNGPEANIFGQTPHFGCCHANFHQAWPKFAASLWLRAPDDGLATLAYAPSSVTTDLDGVEVTVTERTEYPFDDEVAFEVEPDAPVAFPLHLRIPEWTTEPELVLPDGTTVTPDPGEYHVVDREWHPGDDLSLTFDPDVEAERRYHGAVALRRGPLVFSLPVDSERKLVGGDPPVADWEVHPVEPWNYGLDLDTQEETVDAVVRLNGTDPDTNPFSPAEPPVELTVRAGIVPDWHLEDNWAAAPPASPIHSHEPAEETTLVPYGCTMLRVTEFPLLG